MYDLKITLKHTQELLSPMYDIVIKWLSPTYDLEIDVMSYVRVNESYV